MFESGAQTNKISFPKKLFRRAREDDVYAIAYCHSEWSKDVVMEPIFLVKRGRRLPSVNEADGEEKIVWRFPERTSWLREEMEGTLTNP